MPNIHSLMASFFAVAFNQSVLYTLENYCHISPDELLGVFDSTCSDIMNLVAPLSCKCSKIVSDMRRNDATRALRCTDRHAERKREKVNLQVSLDILKKSFVEYQRGDKSVKSLFFFILALCQ